MKKFILFLSLITLIGCEESTTSQADEALIPSTPHRTEWWHQYFCTDETCATPAPGGCVSDPAYQNPTTGWGGSPSYSFKIVDGVFSRVREFECTPELTYSFDGSSFFVDLAPSYVFEWRQVSADYVVVKYTPTCLALLKKNERPPNYLDDDPVLGGVPLE